MNIIISMCFNYAFVILVQDSQQDIFHLRQRNDFSMFGV
jgi:hypothetical protein